MASADSPPTSALPPPSTEQDPANMTYFLPGNPPPHLAPSITHQPETLLMQTLLDSLATVVTPILNHPMIDGPVPDHHLFTDVDAYRLYFQYHSSVVELARNTMRLKRASRLLQFIPGPPGHPGRYRVNMLKCGGLFFCAGAPLCEILSLAATLGFALHAVASKLRLRDKSQLKLRLWWMGACSERFQTRGVVQNFC